MTDRNRHGLIARALAANRREVQDLEQKIAQLHAEADQLRQQLAAAPRRAQPLGPDIGAQLREYRRRNR